MTEPTNTERDAIAAQIRKDSHALHARLRDVAGGSVAPRTLLRAVENAITATGEEIPNVYGNDTLAMAYTRITEAVAAAKIDGFERADEAHQAIRVAYTAERRHRTVVGGDDELAGRRAFDRNADAREMRSWYELTWLERRDWITRASKETGR
ncbi:hypothetical protein [Rhodococcus sp. 14-2470-1a]|uniref:hypothetical protein n=1 Tax=Rhodococcus sp. 14-2470-1a TaxID=2023150 RepID=UPI000B9BD1BA|nr:hypothetical protein [Rhodococcus sp. 14-2470-1a]OZF41935.1 hypothetical protein CH292_27400 [Rhodococcus sp. 14-2470-1a]